jgi:hypothetical protein
MISLLALAVAFWIWGENIQLLIGKTHVIPERTAGLHSWSGLTVFKNEILDQLQKGFLNREEILWKEHISLYKKMNMFAEDAPPRVP